MCLRPSIFPSLIRNVHRRRSPPQWRRAFNTQGGEDACRRHEGPGVPRHGQAYFRWPDEIRPHEDEEGADCQQEEARSWQEVSEESRQGGLQGEEGDLQVIQAFVNAVYQRDPRQRAQARLNAVYERDPRQRAQAWLSSAYTRNP